MALAGHGIVLTPAFIAWPAPLNAYAVYPQTRYLSRRARLGL
jgi:hypothetical protein